MLHVREELVGEKLDLWFDGDTVVLDFGVCQSFKLNFPINALHLIIPKFNSREPFRQLMMFLLTIDHRRQYPLVIMA